MKWLFLVIVTLAALVLVMAVIGALLPRGHRASRAADFHQRPIALYDLVRDFASAQPWRSDGVRSELVLSRDGQVRFRELSRHGAVNYVVTEDRPGERLTVKIADDHLPYGGTWTYDFTPTADGTTVRITEDGEVKNVWFRFLAHFVFGYTGTMETVLRDLGRHFGETPAIRS